MKKVCKKYNTIPKADISWCHSKERSQKLVHLISIHGIFVLNKEPKEHQSRVRLFRPDAVLSQ